MEGEEDESSFRCCHCHPISTSLFSVLFSSRCFFQSVNKSLPPSLTKVIAWKILCSVSCETNRHGFNSESIIVWKANKKKSKMSEFVLFFATS